MSGEWRLNYLAVRRRAADTKIAGLEKHTKSQRRAQYSLNVLYVIGKNQVWLCEILATKNYKAEL
jgi:hypothetical protein